MLRIATLLFALFFAGAAHARLSIDVTSANIEPVPIAISPFGGDPLGAKIAAIVQADLERSGLFKSIDPAAFVQRISDPGVGPNYADWQTIDAQALVVGQTVPSGNGMTTQFRLHDIYGNAELIGRQYKTNEANHRRIAHIIADAIYTEITGEKGYFDSRVVFVDETGPKSKRVKRLAIMDQDGANVRYLTKGTDLVLTPRFSPSKQQITYMSFGEGEPRVYLLDLNSGKRTRVGNFPNMTFSPRFSPDGSKVVFSVSEGGNADIVTMDLASGGAQRVTQTAAIDTAPSYSPDGKRIVFESDRGGRQQLYVMSASGGGQKRISFGPGSYSTPVWSPRGDLIAFTRQSGGQFSVGVMKPDGSGERILTTGYHNEGPTWSPNGRTLMFFRETNNGPRLHTIDLTGQNERVVPTPASASDPAWSPLLK